MLFRYKNIIFLYIFCLKFFYYLSYEIIYFFYKHKKKYTMKYQCIKITIDVVSVKSKRKKVCTFYKEYSININIC